MWKVIRWLGVFLCFSSSVQAQKVMAEQYNITPKVIGGVAVPNNGVPWQVYITMSWGARDYRCSGILISSNVVLTAAHCLVDEKEGVVLSNNVSVWLGITQAHQASDNSATQVFQTIIHPKFDSTELTHDIAIIQLATPIIKAGALPILIMDNEQQTRLDHQLENQWVPFGDIPEIFQVSGWGVTNANNQESTTSQLRQTLLGGVPDRACKELWSDTPLAFDQYHILCATSPKVGVKRDTCTGDSGGPLVWQDPVLVNDRDFGLRLAGIVSFGYGCSDPQYPGVYTQVADYRTWIEAVSGIELASISASKFSRNPFDDFHDVPEPEGGSLSGFLLCLLVIVGVWRQKRVLIL